MNQVARGAGAKRYADAKAALAGVGVVDRIITDLAVFDVTDGGLVLMEAAEGVGLEELRAKTGVAFVVQTRG